MHGSSERPRTLDDAGPITVELLPERERDRVESAGAVSSLQEAILTGGADFVESLWEPEGLEHLARSYWRYLSCVSRGQLKVRYEEHTRTVMLAGRLSLLRFQAPEYEIGPATASVTWRIDRGLLVAREGRGSGWLRIALAREPREPTDGAQRVHARVEVRNFYPWLRGSGRLAGIGARLYSATQVRLHRRITFGFLRSLATLELNSRDS